MGKPGTRHIGWNEDMVKAVRCIELKKFVD
jgi:hypothetical protein